jgi:hypothetical protein
MGATDQQLKQMLGDLAHRHIALAVEVGVLTKRPDCGRGEGYPNNPRRPAEIAARIRRLGGELQYLAMDEPLWFGHAASKRFACHSSIEYLAADAARQISAIRRVFPAIQIGDIEPVGATSPAGWTNQIIEWSRAYQAAVGMPLAFLHADVQWRRGPWRARLAELRNALHSARIEFGIIFDGDPHEQNGVEWDRRAEERMIAVGADPALMPDQAIIQSWHRHPSRMLPETQPGTLTYLVMRYVAVEAMMEQRRLGTDQRGSSSVRP